MLARLDPSARDHVLQCDLRKQGIAIDADRDARSLLRGAVFEVFFNDRALPLSQWPNAGWAEYGGVIEAGSRPRYDEKPDRPGTIAYTGSRPERWTRAKRIRLHGYFCYDWYDDVLEVAELDTESKRMTFTSPHPYGLAANKRYRAIGLLEEIDAPGEWTVDDATGVLYLYPPEDMARASIAISVLKDPLIRLTGTAHITLRDLTLEVTQGLGVAILGGTDNLIAGCTLRNVGTTGVVIGPIASETDASGLLRLETGDPLKDGRRNGVVGCDVYDVGAAGIAITGGDRRTLAAAGHYAENNDIHHYARRQRTNQPAVNLKGVGNRASHNFIHDAPHVGMFYSGNDHVIEYNEATRLCQETGDVGVFYSGRDWTYRGNVVRYNFIHHVQAPGGLGSWAVYLDDCHSSTLIFGNVFYRVQLGVCIGGGLDNVVENNLFIDTEAAVFFDSRGQGWAHQYQRPGGDHRMYDKLKAVRHDRPPYHVR